MDKQIFSNVQAPRVKDPDTCRYAVVLGVITNQYGKKSLRVIEDSEAKKPNRYGQIKEYGISI